MGYFRFWRRMKIAPGVYVNLSKSGPSLSVGPRGAKYTVGAKGSRLTAGVPGTGLFYTTKLSSRKNSQNNRTAQGAGKPLTMGFFKRLVTSDDEEAFVDGCRELVLGDRDKAYLHLGKAAHLADGAYLAGFIALGRGELAKSEAYLSTAEANAGKLGTLFSKYGISIQINLPVTDEVEVQVHPCRRGVLLGLVEICQRQDKFDDAMHYLEKLRKLEPGDILVKLSLAELLMMSSSTDKNACERVVDLSRSVTNESHIHAALLLYKARALRQLGMLDAARETLVTALRRKKDRPEAMLKALRYERAGVYEQLGQHSRARKDLERIYSEDPGYQDVATLLGI